MIDYWTECISEAFDEIGIVATPEQIDFVGGFIEGAHEFYGMVHGNDCIPNPLSSENDRLKRELTEERDKVHCRECGGRGWIGTHGPCHSSTTQCSKCHGEGRHSP